MIAGWTGILVGLAEGASAVYRRRVLHLPTGEYTWNELLWMPPLAAIITLGLVVALAVLVDRTFRARGALLRLVSPLVIGLAVYSAVRSIRPGIASVAALIFALGCAVAFTRVPPRWIERVTRAARWQLPAVTAALLLWAVGVPRFRQYQERRTRESLPAPDVGAPNVLLVIWDTARALSLSLYGHSRKTTPELERLAQNATVFNYAFATSSWSLPSHASMYTGRDAHEIDIGRDVPLDETFPTLGEVLTRHGYVTAGFTGNLFYGSRDFGIARGFSWYDDEAPMSALKVASTWGLTRSAIKPWRRLTGNHQSIVRRRASDVSEKLLRWIDRRGSRPFFASVNFFDAHDPYLPPAPFNLAFTSTQPRYWTGWDRPTARADLRELELAYESCLLYLDHELGRLIAALQARGLLDNTLLIVTSDHGEQFGDHGTHFLGHERSLYTSAIRVPLVMHFPSRFPAGVRRDEVVSIRDIPATVLDIAGLSDEAELPGISLLRYAAGRATPAEIAHPRVAHLEPSNIFGAELERARRQQHHFSLASGSLHYLVNRSGVEELYDFVRDPWETRNLVHDTTMAESLDRFRSLLDSIDQEVVDDSIP